MINPKYVFAILAIPVAIVFFPKLVNGDDILWTRNPAFGPGVFNDAFNWNGPVPGSNDNALFTAVPATVTITNSPSNLSARLVASTFLGSTSPTNTYSLAGNFEVFAGPHSIANLNLDIGNRFDTQGSVVLNGCNIDCVSAEIDVSMNLIGSDMTIENTGLWIGVDSGGMLAAQNSNLCDFNSTRIGSSANASLLLDESNFGVFGNLHVGDFSGVQGALNIDNFSTVTVFDDLNFGNFVVSLGGTINLTGGSVLNVFDDMNMGFGANSELNLDGGNLVVGGTLTNYENGTINLGNSLGVDEVNASLFDNRGNVFITSPGFISIESDVVNSGILEFARTGSALTIIGDVVNSGVFVTGLGDELELDGDVSGIGLYDGPALFKFRRSVNPGSGDGIGTTGVIDIEGPMCILSTFSRTGALNIELAGVNDHDQVKTGGGWGLSSSSSVENPFLTVSVIDGYQPSPGDQFVIVDSAGPPGSGTFAGFSEGSTVYSCGGVDLVINYNAGDGNDIVLTAVEATSNIKVEETGGDFFFSFADLNGGATNSFAAQDFSVGDTGSLFVYYDPSNSELDTGAFLQVFTTETGVINFTGAEVLDFDVVLATDPTQVLGRRWILDSSPNAGYTESVFPGGCNQTLEVTAFTFLGVEGYGMADSGSLFVDTGFDVTAGAYLFARLDFEVVGNGSTRLVLERIDTTVAFPSVGDVNQDQILDLQDIAPFVELLANGSFDPNADINGDGDVNLNDLAPFSNLLQTTGGIVHNGQLISPSFGTARISSIEFVLGDVNCDGLINLLDVMPFIDAIAAGVFVPKADINGDGSVNLLDVDPFIVLLSG